MKLQKTILKETLRIALGTVCLSVLMNIIILLLNIWDVSALMGTLLGAGIAIINFLLLGVTVQLIADNPDSEKRNKLKLQLSYSLRMLLVLAAIAVGVISDYFLWVCVVLPVFFPRITIAIMQIMGLYKPEKLQNDSNSQQEVD